MLGRRRANGRLSTNRRNMLIMFPTPATSGETTLISEAFTDADSTLIGDHTIDPINIPATSWTNGAGAWNIQSNKAAPSSAINAAHAHCNAGVADCTLLCSAVNTAATGANRISGLLARYADANNYWRIGFNVTDDVFIIVERAATTETVRASVAIADPGSTAHDVAAVLSGATITATLDGASEISYAGATLNQTATKHGVVGRNTTDVIDNFQVKI